MKTKFKVLFAAVLLAGIGGSAFAQTVASTTLTANATVVTALSIAQTQALSFGNLSATTTGGIVVHPQGTGNSNVTNSAIGKMTITGSGTLSISITPPTSITLAKGEDTMVATLTVYGNTTDASGTALALTTGTGNTKALVDGAYYLFVGGTIPALTNQATGAYSGTGTFSVTYN
jgi:hypothetical protein